MGAVSERVGDGLMGAFISKQPNGKYCRFSTVVDCVTHGDMTEDDYIDLCAKRAKAEARDILENHLVPFSEVVKETRFTNTSKREFNNWLQSVGYETTRKGE